MVSERLYPIQHRSSDRGIKLVKQFEGLRLQRYKDQAGLWTIGYGHLIPSGTPVAISKEEADKLLHKDMAVARTAITKLVSVPLTQGEFDALVSFAFNLGQAKIAKSTLIAMVNERRYDRAAGQFSRWIYADGKPSKGLKERRRIERSVFLGLPW